MLWFVRVYTYAEHGYKFHYKVRKDSWSKGQGASNYDVCVELVFEILDNEV
jgi:hypothetical protein